MKAGSSTSRFPILRVIIWIAIVLFVVVVLPFLSVRIPIVRGWMLDKSLHGTVLSDEWKLRIDSVPRFDPWGLRMRGIHLVHIGPEGERDWASLGRLELKWNPVDLLRRRVWAGRIGVDDLMLQTDVDAPVILPREGTSDEPAESKELPWLRLGSSGLGFRVLNGQELLASGSVSLGEFEHQEGRIRGTIKDVKLSYHPDSIEVRLQDGEITGSLTSAIHLNNARLTLEEIASSILSGRIAIPQVEGDQPHVMAAFEIGRLDPKGFAALRGLALPFAESDSLAGEIRLEYEPRETSARVDLGGRLFDGGLESLNLLASRRGDTISVHDVGIVHRCGSINGEGRILVGPRSLSWTIDIEDLNLADNSLAAFLPGAPRSSIAGSISGRANLGGGRTAATAAGVLNVSRLSDWRPGSVTFEGSLDDRIVRVDSIHVGELGDGFVARGDWAIDTGVIDAEVDLDGIALEEWIEPLVGIGFAGRIDGELLLDGPIGSPMIAGNIAGERFRVVGVGAEELRIDSISGTLIPPRVNGFVHATGMNVYGAPIDSATFDVDWDEFLAVSTRASVDTIAVATDVEIAPADPGSVVVRSLDLRAGTLAPWRSANEARIEWRRGSVSIDDLFLESEDGVLNGRVAIAANGGGIDGSFRTDGLNLLAIERLFNLPDSTLAGRLDLDLALGGTTEIPEVDLAIQGRQILAARWPVGTLSAEISSGSDGTLRVDSLNAGSIDGAGTVVSSGIVAHLPSPLPSFLGTIGDSLASHLAQTDLSGHLSVDGLSMSRIVRTALSTTPQEGRGIFAEPTDPMMSRIRTVRAGEDSAKAGVADEVAGLIGVDLTVGGTAAEPIVSANGRLIDFRLYQARADSLLFGLSYLSENVTLDSLVWHRQHRASHARGAFPVRLSLVPERSGVIKDQPLMLDAELPEIDLGILGVVSRKITDPEGFLSGSISISGTPERLWPNGQLTIKDGGIRIPNREERIYGINGSVTLDSTGVSIAGLNGRIGVDGELSASGHFQDLEDFDLEAEVSNVTLYETGLYHFTIDANFEAFPVEVGEVSEPLITGSIDILEGAIVGDMANTSPPSGRESEPSPLRAEIDIFAPGNIRLQTSVASVEMGEAENLHVSLDDSEVNISGGIKVLSGRYRVFNNIFTITSGSVEFRDTGEGVIEPILDVYAETHVGMYADGAADRMERVTIHVTGPVNELYLDFSSESDLASDEIITLLSIGRFRSKEGEFGVSNVTDPSRQYLITEMVSQIESEITQLITPLQNVSVRPGDAADAPWIVNVRQMVLPQVSLAYTRELATTAEQEISVHYNLRGRLYLNAAVEQRMTEGALADRYSLDLKMRFEYK